MMLQDMSEAERVAVRAKLTEEAKATENKKTLAYVTLVESRPGMEEEDYDYYATSGETTLQAMLGTVAAKYAVPNPDEAVVTFTKCNSRTVTVSFNPAFNRKPQARATIGELWGSGEGNRIALNAESPPTVLCEVTQYAATTRTAAADGTSAASPQPPQAYKAPSMATPPTPSQAEGQSHSAMQGEEELLVDAAAEVAAETEAAVPTAAAADVEMGLAADLRAEQGLLAQREKDRAMPGEAESTGSKMQKTDASASPSRKSAREGEV